MTAGQPASHSSTGLRRGADELSHMLPPLLAAARQLAATVQLGAHGRRRAGLGDEFWQYRPAHPGDPARSIDWRRSGRSDGHFLREREWQAAQSVQFWVDDAQAMDFTGAPDRPSKADRARLLALALAVLLARGGERVGMADAGLPPRAGEGQLLRLAERLTAPSGQADFGAPRDLALLSQARAVFISDFLGDPQPIAEAVTEAADRGVSGALLQVLDPMEEAFPFRGRSLFESMTGGLRHETRKAADLRDRYLQRLAERRAFLSDLARASGWHFHGHHTGDPAPGALLWLYHAMGRLG